MYLDDTPAQELVESLELLKQFSGGRGIKLGFNTSNKISKIASAVDDLIVVANQVLFSLRDANIVIRKLSEENNALRRGIKEYNDAIDDIEMDDE